MLKLNYYHPVGEPGLARQAVHAVGAVVRWAGNGFNTVSPEIESIRLSICRGCSLWNPEGNAGLGKCRHAKCGCTKFKLKLATEKCPDGLW